MEEHPGRDRLTLLGDSKAEFRGLESFKAPTGLTSVRMVSDEVTALCPVTGQPDWYVVSIEYVPDALCLESKGVKLYLGGFRATGLFVEQLAAAIAHDVVDAISPVGVSVEVTQKSRGGVSIVARSKLGSP